MLTFKKRSSRAKLKQAKRGDTLIEVALAIGILGFVVAAVITTMNVTLFASQSNLENTMARNEIDIQAEAIRYVHNAYTAQRDLIIKNQEYKLVWDAILAQAVKPEEIPELADITECNVYYPQDSESAAGNIRNLYANSTKAFIINTHRLSTTYTTDSSLTSSIVVTAANSDPAASKFQAAIIYPRIIYGSTDTERDLSSKPIASSDDLAASELYRAEGIWIQVACGDNTDNCNGQKSGAKPSYYDFYIRTCWEASDNSSSAANTIGTIIRLHNPDTYDAEKTTVTTTATSTEFSLTYYLSNGTTLTTDRATVASASSQRFTVKDQSIIKPSSLQANNPDGWTFAGWCASTSTTCNSTAKIYHPDDNIVVSASNPHLYMIALYERNYSINYDSGGISGASHIPATQSGTCYTTSVQSNGSTCTQTLSSQTPTASGQTFTSWSHNGNNYGPGGTITLTNSDTAPTLTAQWTPTVTTITAYLKFDQNTSDSVSNIPGTISCTYNSDSSCDIAIPDVIPTREGYIFVGWGTSTTGDILCYRSYSCDVTHSELDDGIDDNHTATLYAIWHSAYLQDMTSDFCSSRAFDAGAISLIDRRDGKQYLVFNAKNGDCWLGQNMAYDELAVYSGSHSDGDWYSQGDYYNWANAQTVCGNIGSRWKLPTGSLLAENLWGGDLWGYSTGGSPVGIGSIFVYWTTSPSSYIANNSLSYFNTSYGFSVRCYFDN